MKNINNEDLSRFMGLGDEAHEMRNRQHDVKLSNETIIILGYLCKEMLEMVTKCKAWLFFEQANCYSSCFHVLRKLLKVVDQEYMATHHHLAEFYRSGHELERNGDRLWFVNVPEATQAADTVTNPVQETIEMKTNKRSAFLSRHQVEELRLQAIDGLASRRATIVPVATYDYSRPLVANMEIDRDEIADHGVSFETGSPRDLVQIRIRPDVPAKIVVAILVQMIAAVCEHGDNWLKELVHAIERLKMQLTTEPK